MKKTFTKEDATSERMSMKGEARGFDREFWDSLTTGSGPLVAGALPGLDVQQEKNMADALTGGAAAKAPKAKRAARADDRSVPVAPATLKE